MKIECAWCGQSLNTDSLVDNSERPVSHGICKECARKMFESMSEPMQAFLDRFPGPVLVMDSDENVLAANSRAIEIAAVAESQVRGLKCGNVLRCQQAQQPDGCSRREKCRSCIMLQAMRYSHETGLPRTRVPARPEFEWLHDKQKTVIYVSSEKIGDLVVLTLEEELIEN